MASKLKRIHAVLYSEKVDLYVSLATLCDALNELKKLQAYHEVRGSKMRAGKCQVTATLIRDCITSLKYASDLLDTATNSAK